MTPASAFREHVRPAVESLVRQPEDGVYQHHARQRSGMPRLADNQTCAPRRVAHGGDLSQPQRLNKTMDVLRERVPGVVGRWLVAEAVAARIRRNGSKAARGERIAQIGPDGAHEARGVAQEHGEPFTAPVQVVDGEAVGANELAGGRHAPYCSGRDAPWKALETKGDTG